MVTQGKFRTTMTDMGSAIHIGVAYGVETGERVLGEVVCYGGWNMTRNQALTEAKLKVVSMKAALKAGQGTLHTKAS